MDNSLGRLARSNMQTLLSKFRERVDVLVDGAWIQLSSRLGIHLVSFQNVQVFGSICLALRQLCLHC